MDFEFNYKKSSSNHKKHGIDFIEGQKIWDDSERIIIPATSKDEPRFQLIGKIGKDHWSAFYTIRENKIRIISIRRSRKNEEEIYQS